MNNNTSLAEGEGKNIYSHVQKQWIQMSISIWLKKQTVLCFNQVNIIFVDDNSCETSRNLRLHNRNLTKAKIMHE